MFTDIFSELIAMLTQVFRAISAVVAILLIVAAALAAFKKHKVALFLEDPTKSDKFNKWHAINGDSYDNIKDSAKDYIEQVKLASEFKYFHRKEAARERFYERRDAYRYMQAMDRYTLKDIEKEKEKEKEKDKKKEKSSSSKPSNITYDNGAIPNNDDYYDDGYWASVEEDYYR